MARLIDADELKKVLNDAIWLPGWEHIRDKVLQDIDGQPTVDAAPVVHGEWIGNVDCVPPARVLLCSNCNHTRVVLGDSPGYCERCGAKMDGGEKE